MKIGKIKELPIEYRVGIDGLDKQHAEILQILSNIVQRIKEPHNTNLPSTDEILEDLKHYAKVHFSYEEKLMRKAEYDKIEAHIGQHKIFIDKITEAQHLEDKNQMTHELAIFIKDWFINHINKVDKNTVMRMREMRKEAIKIICKSFVKITAKHLISRLKILPNLTDKEL